jgi:hypothetical protein
MQFTLMLISSTIASYLAILCLIYNIFIRLFFLQVGHDIDQSKVNYASGRLQPEDVILEVQGQKVAGYTERDVLAWLHHCCRNGNPVVIKTLPNGNYSFVSEININALKYDSTHFLLIIVVHLNLFFNTFFRD